MPEPPQTTMPEPLLETNTTDKLCARCADPASFRCTKCFVTFYCSSGCQKLHWTRGLHKKVCNPSPSHNYKTTDSQQHDSQITQTHKFFIVNPGHCSRKPTSTRDAVSQLILPLLPDHTNNDNNDFHLLPESSSNKLTLLCPLLSTKMAQMGWNIHPSSTLLTGYNLLEDSTYFRIFYNPSATSLDEENIVGAPFVSHEQNAQRGCFLICKIANSENNESLLPFPVSDLIDTYLWRTHLGKSNLLSSRIWRENQRRLELELYLRLAKNNTQEI